VARDQGDYPAAFSLYMEGLMINRELGDRNNIAYLLEDMGGLAAKQGQAERAMRLVGAASMLRQTIGAPLSPAEQTQLERMLEPVTQALGEIAQAAALGEGRAMSLEQAIDYALSSRP